ncbi:MAG: hypothetical protein QM765_27420 [Myxococcales bacterium]
MRFVRLLIFAALAVFAAACTKGTAVKAPPKVNAGPDQRTEVKASVELFVNVTSAAEIETYEWKVVVAPDLEKTSIAVPATSLGDVVSLQTGAIPGLFVVAVRVTDVDGLTSDFDYVNVELTGSSPNEPVKIALACSAGCRTSSSQPDWLFADEETQLTFDVQVLEGQPTGVNWSFTLDGPDGSHQEPAVLTPAADGLSATVELPRTTAPLTLRVSATAYVSGVNDSTASVTVEEEDTVDEPPTLAFEWHIPGGKPGDPVKVLPGDAIYVKAVVADPNGDAVTCEFPSNEIGGPYFIQQVTDPCSRTVYPLRSGKVTIAVDAKTSKTDGTTRQILTLDVAHFRVAGTGLTGVSIKDDGMIVASDGSAGYRIYDAKDANLTAKVVDASFTGSKVAAFYGSKALVGFTGSKELAAYDLSTSTELPDFIWPASALNPATGTVAMASSAKTGRVWMAMSEGIGVFDPSPTAASALAYWYGGQVLPTAIAWSPSPKTPSDSGYVWYAAGGKVYCQTTESLANWQAGTDGHGVEVGTIPAQRVSAMAYGSAAGDLWVGTAPTGGVSTGFPVFLFKNAVDAATGEPKLGTPLDFFAPLDGGIGGVAVEQDGPYAGDAWVVAGGAVMRVSRAVVDEATGERGAVELELQTDIGGIVNGISVAGRRVAVASESGLAVVP